MALQNNSGSGKSVLYISYDGLTDPLGQSQILPYLAGLADLGYRITILSCEKKNIWNLEHKRIQTIVNQHGINWQCCFYRKKPPVFSAMFNVFHLRRKATQMHRQGKFQIVHCRSYLPSLIGLSMKKKFNLKFIFDMRGFWADERSEGGIWNLKNPIYKTIYSYFKRKELSLLSNADAIISLTEKAKEIIHAFPISNQPVPISVIPCCTNVEHFSKENIRAEKVSPLKKRLNISNDDFILSYLGSLGTWYCLDEMLLFFKCLLQNRSNAKFLFITPEAPEIVIRAAHRLRIDRSRIIIIKASYSEVPEVLSLSHISIFFIKPVFSKQASSPTKLAEVLAMGIPVICNSGIGDTDNLIRANTCGLVIKNFDEKNFQKAINAIPEILTVSPQKIAAAARSHFSLDEGIEKYHRVYSTLFGP